jgi:glutaredoxin
MKNVREESEYENKLVQLCGNGEVPTLVVDGKPMRGSEDINKFLVDNFFD